MQRSGPDLVLSPTDLTKHLACAHITTLDLAALDGAGARPKAADDALDLIFRLGLAHEAGYLQQLRDEGRTVVEIGPARTPDERRQRELETVEAMRSGVDVIYQATLYDGAWSGQPDFLLRIERPSDLGAWSYDIADTKLARRLKVPALLQMATYAERLAVLQGTEPDRLYVVTGDGSERPWRLVDVAAFARHARGRMRGFLDEQPPTYPVPVPQCGQCRWIDACTTTWIQQDDLSRVAFMRGDHRQALIAHGIRTLADLGRSTVADLPRSIGRSTAERLVHQASLQLWERENNKARYDLLPPEPRTGLLRLPPPDPGDLYLDFEGDPYAESGSGREYLAGLGGTGRDFLPIWAHSFSEERDLTIRLVDRLLAHWEQHPCMHVYHYAPYETTALRRLTQRHGVREAELDRLLRGERFVDLYTVVRQGVRISKPSYSIKKMEAFYWGHIRNQNPDVADAMSSVIAYEKWCTDGNGETLPKIEAYNRDDVHSTLDLHLWLEQRRADLETEHGQLPRPSDEPEDPARPPGDTELAETALADQLQGAGEDLFAGLVQFHRREARPAYWDLFRLEALDDDELVDDSAAVGRLSMPADVGKVARSRLYRYDFPPQDTKLCVGDAAYGVDDRKQAGTVYELDAAAGFLVLKRQGEPLTPRGLTEKNVLSDQKIRAAIAAAARERLAGTPNLASALVDRVVPSAITDVVTTGLALDGAVLAVQGPPGSGKTTVGAELVRELLDAGKTVGITANSHAVIGNFLSKVGRPALQRCNDEEQHCGAADVDRAASTAEVAAAIGTTHRLVGGTAWMWSEPDLAGTVDVMLVDEAGQFSLANAVAVSRAARSMVLLGDPQQLAQPTRAEHPAAAGVSALGHLLDGAETIPPDRGVFLGTSWRMHPEITAYVSDLSYEGRLGAAPGRESQAVIAGPGLTGSGLRVQEVVHAGNAAASREEVAAVATLWQRLVTGTYSDRHGTTRAMTADDVLVVAPYNNQVGLLKSALPPGARVGTVDKFQGQEAPVVVYSMTSSSSLDAPRGIGFLYDTHRLNVAVSRAQALAVVVLSTTLLDASVGSPEQLRQVNALCRLVEQAEKIDARSPTSAQARSA